MSFDGDEADSDEPKSTTAQFGIALKTRDNTVVS